MRTERQIIRELTALKDCIEMTDEQLGYKAAEMRRDWTARFERLSLEFVDRKIKAYRKRCRG